MRDDEISMDEERTRDPRPEPHEPPVLIKLGSYAELTRGSSGPLPDGLEVGSVG
jgi:hypothetical protein